MEGIPSHATLPVSCTRCAANLTRNRQAAVPDAWQHISVVYIQIGWPFAAELLRRLPSRDSLTLHQADFRYESVRVCKFHPAIVRLHYALIEILLRL
jgi:hypothetical protein